MKFVELRYDKSLQVTIDFNGGKDLLGASVSLDKGDDPDECMKKLKEFVLNHSDESLDGTTKQVLALVKLKKTVEK